jgi:hypothetical protein
MVLRGGPPSAVPLLFCSGRLPNDSPDIIDMFTGRYQATGLDATVHLLPGEQKCGISLSVVESSIQSPNSGYFS